MAGPTRTDAAPLEAELLANGHEFSFFQAMRLLRLLTRDADGGAGAGGSVRVRPELSLTFPASDLAGIERRDDGYLVTARFLGLYGPASPLPTFYTEDLLDEAAADGSVTRAFLDIVNGRLFDLFSGCAAKYRLFLQEAEEHDGELAERLFSLMGLGEPALRETIPDARSLLRYIGLFSQHPRSALGLQTLLADALGVAVEVVPCVRRQVAIPPDQRMHIGTCGSRLGVDTVVGSEIEDRTGMFRLRLGPLSREEFTRLLPGAPLRQRLDLLVGLYLHAPLAWETELLLAPGETPAATLGGGAGSRLGWDVWISSDGSRDAGAVVFPQNS